ncbi:MAG TPA: DALR domain-containing protein, partial [Chloroflexota bacterium]|nr:DALR domain-containing protein [Chloroflexota bacterium]
ATLDQFRQAMDDDLNTPRAIAALEALAKQINATNDGVARQPELATPELAPALETAGTTFHDLTSVLGLELTEPAGSAGAGKTAAGKASDQDIQRLVDERMAARQGKDFAMADRIRQELIDLGITIEDRPQGTIWYRQ